MSYDAVRAFRRTLDGCCTECGQKLPGRCAAVFVTDYGDRRCDLPAGHDGPHIRNDGCGRPEYVWTHDGQRWTW